MAAILCDVLQLTSAGLLPMKLKHSGRNSMEHCSATAACSHTWPVKVVWVSLRLHVLRNRERERCKLTARIRTAEHATLQSDVWQEPVG